ncbi:hypothetical protein NNO02_08965 [Citrobacter sp. Awk 2]|uniref:hypothetical protein n=1 Tax=Citrobacter sp. Awk 2 TaxID=2963959 RepID=UPI002303F2D6|nr:hypothetical protein [Citrobacter sp. Awk 2]MDA8502580.1 hypothetical protein [Citrobacter sp. Awk 2]
MKPTYEELEKKCELQQSKLAAINELMSVVEKASDIAKAGIEELQSQNADMAVQLANSESKCRALAAELSAVDKIHNEAVFITDDHYEQCPSEVQKMIRSLAVLQIPAYDAFLAEVRAQGVEMFAASLKVVGGHEHPYSAVANEFAAQLRKGAVL